MSNLCPSCREPLDHPSGDGCAAMTKHRESIMDNEPFYLGVEEVKEHEDGSATYTFHMDDNASKHLTELGLKLVLYCGVASVDIQDVYDWILSQAPKEPEAKLPEGRTPLSDDWFREKAAAFSFDEYGHYGENNGPLPPTKKCKSCGNPSAGEWCESCLKEE